MRLATMARGVARATHPAWLSVIGQDAVGLRGRPASSSAHLAAAIDWIRRAQDACGRGVAYGYSLREGWMRPYPETTGYIIPTLYDYAPHSPWPDLRQRALRMADWEIEVQLESGAVQAGPYRGPDSERRPAVFNTGQVILGWQRAYQETGGKRYLAAATRAADWLVQAQDSDGAWRVRAPQTETVVHAYDVRVAWSLLEMGRTTGAPAYGDAGRANVRWALAQQQDNGWFQNNAFHTSKGKWTLPLTHTIAYVMEGLLEIWRLEGDEQCLEAARKTAYRLLEIFERTGFLAAAFDHSWRAHGRYSCLTGAAQTAAVWLRLHAAHEDARLLNAALRLNDFVKSTQSLGSLLPGVRGGVKGSQPIFGKYTPFTYINWAAKFLADSLMLEEPEGRSHWLEGGRAHARLPQAERAGQGAS